MSAADALDWRYTVSRDALLTVEEAAACLRVRRADGIDWLRQAGVVRSVLGRDLVLWGDVIAALTARPAPVEVPSSAARTLLEMPSGGALDSSRRRR